MTDHENRVRRHARIVAKAWQDEAYRNRLVSDPTNVLREEGVDIPEGKTVKVVENSDDVSHFVLPAKPSAPMSEEEIASHRMGPLDTCA